MIDVRAVMNAVSRVIDSQSELKVVFEDVSTPCTDLKSGVVILPHLDYNWSESELLEYLGYIHHECSHHAKEVIDMREVSKGINMSSLFGQLLNALEDVRIEYNRYEEWPGRDEALSYVHGVISKDIAKQVQEGLKDGLTLSDDSKLMYNVVYWIDKYRATWQPDVKSTMPDREIMLDEELQEKLSTLTPLLASMDTAQDVLDLTRRLLDESPDHDAEEEEQAANSGDSDEGEEEEGEDVEASGSGSSNGVDKGEGEGTPDVSPEEMVIDYGDISKHEVATHNKQMLENNGIKIKYTKDYGKYYFNSKIHIKPLPEEEIDRQPSMTGCSSYPAYQHGRKLSHSVSRLFQSQTQRRKQSNLYEGRLNPRHYHRIPEGAKDVFYRRRPTPRLKDVALFILTDMSGSMSGSKHRLTAASTTLLLEALNKFPISIKVGAFSTRGSSGVEHWILKDWHERKNSERMLREYEAMTRHMSGNSDGEAVMWAHNDLMGRTESRKILIVLSDGQPAGVGHGDESRYLKDVAKMAEANLEVYGVGIESSDVKRYYTDCVVLRDVNELEACLLELVDDAIFKGAK